MKRKISKKLTTLLTVLALLLLIIPAGTLFADSIADGETLPGGETTASSDEPGDTGTGGEDPGLTDETGDPEATESQDPEETVDEDSDGDEDEDMNEEEEEELAEDEAEAGETEASGEPSENAIVVAERIMAARALGIAPGRLNLIDRLAAISGKTRAELLPDWQEAPVQDIMKEIKRYRLIAMGKELPTDPAVTEPGETTETAETTEPSETAGKGHGKARGHNK